MATLESLAVRANLACDIIESMLPVTLRRIHKNREMLRAEQLETIANALRASTRGTTPDTGTNTLTDSETRLNAALALLESGQWTKAQMEAVLQDESS